MNVNRAQIAALDALRQTVSGSTRLIVTSWVLMPIVGILGVGIGWLLGLGVVATIIMIGRAPWLPTLLSTRIDAARGAVLLRRVGRTAISRHGPSPSSVLTISTRPLSASIVRCPSAPLTTRWPVAISVPLRPP